MNIDEFLNEIEVQFLKKSLSIPIELVPTITKIIVPKDIWEALIKGEYCQVDQMDYSEEGPNVENEDKIFKKCVEHQTLERTMEKRIKKNQWIEEQYKTTLTPNIGGIPIELGDINKVVVIVEGKIPVKRVFKRRQYENLTEDNGQSQKK